MKRKAIAIADGEPGPERPPKIGCPASRGGNRLPPGVAKKNKAIIREAIRAPGEDELDRIPDALDSSPSFAPDGSLLRFVEVTEAASPPSKIADWVVEIIGRMGNKAAVNQEDPQCAAWLDSFGKLLKDGVQTDNGVSTIFGEDKIESISGRVIETTNASSLVQFMHMINLMQLVSKANR